MFIKTHSLDYFHGRLSIINTQNTNLLKQLEYYLSKILVKVGRKPPEFIPG